MTQSDGLDAFGAALVANGFFGTSQTNPNDMRNNCVYVSIARMEHYANVNELWQHTHGQPLENQPLSVGEMLDLLHRLGFSYQCAQYSSTATQTAYQQLIAADRGCSQLGDELILLGFVRHNDTGHCINYLKSAPDWKAPVQRYYFDFQHSNDGGSSKTHTAETQEAKAIVLLYHGAFHGSRSENAETQQREFDQYIAGREQRKQALVAARLLPAFFTDL